MTNLSDKGLAVFTFAAYHQLAAGEAVKDVVLHDGAGHAADPAGVQELQDLGLATVEADRAVFTEQGRSVLDEVVSAIRSVSQGT